jgi:hypothetical protein
LWAHPLSRGGLQGSDRSREAEEVARVSRVVGSMRYQASRLRCRAIDRSSALADMIDRQAEELAGATLSLYPPNAPLEPKPWSDPATLPEVAQ